MNELPEGFQILEEPKVEQPTFELPEGFQVQETKSSEPISTLMNPVQETNPFLSAKRDEIDTTKPQLDLISPRNIQPEMTADELKLNRLEDIKAKHDNLFKKYSSSGNAVLGYFGDSEAKLSAEKDSVDLKNDFILELRNRGIEDAYINKDGDIVTIVDGVETEVDSTFVKSILASKAELAGSISGGIYGARIGGAAGSTFGPVGTGVGALVGGAIGGATGAFAGKGVDILANQLDIIQKIDNDLALQQMTEAGVVDTIGLVVGASAIKSLQLSGKVVSNLYGKIVDRNIEGAYSYAKQHFNVTEEQIKEIVDGLEAIAGPLRGTDKQKGLQALARTRAGGETIVANTNMFDPVASSNVANSIFKNAEDLLQTSKNLTSDNIKRTVGKGLVSYEKNVKDYYGAVKQAGADFTEGYKFDYEQTGLKPILDEIGSKIEDPRMAQNFANLLSKVGDISEGRTFSDLVDLRQLVNEVKFSTSNISRSNASKLDAIKSSIDEEITLAADTYIPNSKAWLDSWSNAKKSYSEMKQVEKNVLFKALTKPGISEQQTVNLLSRYIGSGTDELTGVNVFNQVMEKLPKQVRSKVDGAVVDNLVNKFSYGPAGGNKAIDFPRLSEELNKISWKNSAPKVQQLTRTVGRMAEVFKNDVNLAKVSGKINLPREQSYLTTDPSTRIKFGVMSKVFNYTSQLLPTKNADSLSLVNNVAKLFEDPLNSKTIKEIQNALPKDRRFIRNNLDFEQQRNELANEYIARKAKLAEILGTDNIVPRLVWRETPVAPTTELPSGQTLYGTQKGTVSTNPTSAIMEDRSQDLIADFVQNSIKQGVTERIGVQDAAGVYDKVVTKIDSYFNDQRLIGISKNVRAKLNIDDTLGNQAMIKKTIESEANILIKRIEKDLGVKMPQSEADKLVRMKFKEAMETWKKDFGYTDMFNDFLSTKNSMSTLTIDEIPGNKIKWDVYALLGGLGLASQTKSEANSRKVNMGTNDNASEATVKQYFADIESSGGNYNAFNKGSKAYGKYQITPIMMKDLGITMRDVNTPAKQESIMSKLIPKYQSRLEQFDLPVNKENMFVLHNLGMTGGIRVIKGNPTSEDISNMKNQLHGKPKSTDNEIINNYASTYNLDK